MLACPASHISPLPVEGACLVAPEFARAIELSKLVKDKSRSKPPPRRDVVKSFSRASRRRLLWKIGQIHEQVLEKALFITLTYPAGDPCAERRQVHLDSLLKRLRRKAPNASAIWKVEYTKVGTPHFHLLILNLNFWAHAEVAKAWSDIVQSENIHHAQAGTQVVRVASVKHVARYIVKYVSKSGPLPENHRGRIWGTAGPLLRAFSPKRIFVLGREAFLAARRLLDKVRSSHKRSSPFRRQTNLNHTQRWYIQGSEVIRYAKWLGASEINVASP